MMRKRLLLPEFISPELCKHGTKFPGALRDGLEVVKQELVFIHKSCGVVGYRPHVFSTTLSHLVATNCAALLMPFIALRERVKEAVEEFFECEFELFVEFTGLISWTRGANIGWHSDDNRNYLQQRHFSAVCYLNTYEQDFHGGLFHFRDGEPATVVPTLGTILIYSANEDNVHSVDEVTAGERFTMALWFTRDCAHDEDRKILVQLFNIRPLAVEEPNGPRPLQAAKQVYGEDASLASQTSQTSRSNSSQKFTIPSPASTSMYWVDATKIESEAGHEGEYRAVSDNVALAGEKGYDIRVARLASLGFCFSKRPTELVCDLDAPLKLRYQKREIPYEFTNSIHALQVVHFYEFTHRCKGSSHRGTFGFIYQQPVQQPYDDEIENFKRQRTSASTMLRAPKDNRLPASVKSDASQRQTAFTTSSSADASLHSNDSTDCSVKAQEHMDEDVMDIDAIVKSWDDYMVTLWRDLLQFLQVWRTHGSMHSIQT